MLEPWGFEHIGQYPRLSAGDKTSLNSHVEELVRTGASGDLPIVLTEEESFSYPPRDYSSAVKAERLSLTLHSKYSEKTSLCEKPSESIQEWALCRMEDWYSPVVWTLPNDWDSYDSFRKCLTRLDMTSSPGYPYMVETTTIGSWLGYDGFLSYNEQRVSQLWHDTRDVLSGKWMTILRVFIKSEPHKASKVREGRWRLIMGSPLPVQMAWHMVFRYQNDLEIEKSYFIPSQQGIKLCGGGWKNYRAQWVSRGYSIGLDKTAWDWTVPGWLIDLEFRFRCRMARNLTPAWIKAAKLLYDGMFVNPIFILSDGSLYRQRFHGFMKSGCVNTISSNSHMQILVHLIVCKIDGISENPYPVACGDDTLQAADHCGDLTTYSSIGSLIKKASEGLEFVGHDFLENGPQPLYFRKHVFTIMHSDEENLPAVLDSYLRLYAHSYQYSYWERLALALGLERTVKSREFYLRWYDWDD